eukprot:CAMPEP_0182906718 /NCGR_PEP_ID=MMETSP0034_2-20130328/33965_1 /TAXON_ID=156128 /ORGANISM="Nephroselmis pyriformis, Strain CCMP717" /LENGTH=51 /DNA_ID=CAMNT_0025042469 /DNA_START=171 /DNA_END=323 /DNA_ORIENTATION=-
MPLEGGIRGHEGGIRGYGNFHASVLGLKVAKGIRQGLLLSNPAAKGPCSST